MNIQFQHYLLGLFAVANNIPAIPVYLALCGDLPRAEQNKLCGVATISSFATMIIAMFSGAIILEFFQISIDAFRIAGGILLIITGINMVNSKEASDKKANTDPMSMSDMISVAVIPIAIPLTTGAGTISTVILFAEKLPDMAMELRLLAAIIVMTIVNFLSFRYSTGIVKLLGHNGMNVLTKVFGLITLALGVQFLLTGVGASFPVLLK